MFDNSKWIWLHNEEKPDEYVDFLVEFEIQSAENVNLNIAVDGNFEVYMNSSICAIGSCADYPNEKYYDTFSLDDHCKIGTNTMKITVWHIGAANSVYAMSNAGLIFDIRQNDTVLVSSDEKILCQSNLNYTNGLCKSITSQLGYSYRYDNTVINSNSYSTSIVVNKTSNIKKRGIDTLQLKSLAKTSINDDGTHILIDFGRETVGYLELDFTCEAQQELLIVFGEHLDDDGHVPRIIGARDFSVGFVAKEGKNKFLGGMRRLAGRYLEIEYEHPLNIAYFGLREVEYATNIIDRKFEKELHQRIYNTCVYTLKCCMHEHYEDCPWREQALYSLDSRNQMLCGYIAFEEYKYARHNLILLAKSLHNGILRLTSPTDRDLPIPFFSLTFIQQLSEYVNFSHDRSILDEIGDIAYAIMSTFISRIDSCGLISAFPAPAWNFYEWSAGNDGSGVPPLDKERYDLCLNSMFIYVFGLYSETIGELPTADIESMRRALKQTLYREDKGLFVNDTKSDQFTVIGNALAILAGVGDKSLAERIISMRDQITDNTLSMNCYLYDALLSIDLSYKEYILNDIETKYAYMLDNGATTFWETIEGWRAFSNAGSLCHGWSALPIFYLTYLV